MSVASYFSRPKRERLRGKDGRYVKMPLRPLTRIERMTLKMLKGPNPYTRLMAPVKLPT